VLIRIFVPHVYLREDPASAAHR